jgi:hypothetical protein
MRGGARRSLSTPPGELVLRGRFAPGELFWAAGTAAARLFTSASARVAYAWAPLAGVTGRHQNDSFLIGVRNTNLPDEADLGLKGAPVDPQNAH